MIHRTKRSVAFPVPLIALALVALLVVLAPVACGPPSEEELRRVRDDIRAMLLEYLPKMADAYATGETEQLEPYAAPKEIAILEKNIRDLARQGRVVDTELEELTVEGLNLDRHVNAYVTTLEVWDVKVYAAGSENLLGEDDDQRSRVRYQLKRRDGQWQLLSRHSTPLEE